MKPITTLLHFSGGQDSTYTAYHWLKNNPHEKLLLHHITLIHRAEPRANNENKAVKKILQYFNENRLTNYVYHSSTFDYGTLPRISIKDIQICSLFTGIILRTPQWQTINKLILSWHKGEVNAPEIERGFRVKKMLTALEVDRDIDFLFPIENMTRKEMAENMPKELMQMIHNCRKPIGIMPCKRCKTCLEMIQSGLL
jgi:7-cyano-7-deazaguanine synthase in queuosine biosynthesis